MKKYICPKCGAISTAKTVETTLKAGDNGISKETIMLMDCCGYAPLFEPKEAK